MRDQLPKQWGNVRGSLRARDKIRVVSMGIGSSKSNHKLGRGQEEISPRKLPAAEEKERNLGENSCGKQELILTGSPSVREEPWKDRRK